MKNIVKVKKDRNRKGASNLRENRKTVNRMIFFVNFAVYSTQG